MNKKILIIIGAIVGLIIIGVAVFFFTRSTEPGQESKKGGIFSFFFPSSKDRLGSSFPSPPDGSKDDLPPPSQPARNLIQLTDSAVAGATFNKKNQKIQYFEKSTGHLYEIEPRGTNKKQLSITTIPKIFEVLWTNNPPQAVLRYFNEENSNILESTRTFIVSSVATSTKELEGIFLALDTKSVAVSPNGENIFYLSGDETTLGITASFENKDQEQIFYSTFSEFAAEWHQDGVIALITKPSASADGYLYQLNPKTQSLAKILGQIKGLTARYFSSGEKVLYSQSKNKSFTTQIYNIAEKSSTPFNYPTLPEKCIFSNINANKLYCAVPKTIPASNYPDDWYKGIISFSDALWQIDIANGSTELIFDEGNFDIINLFTNEEENYLFFQDKKDGALWSLKIKN